MNRKRWLSHPIGLMFVTLLLVACIPIQSAPTPTSTPIPPASTATLTPAPTPTATNVPTTTPSPQLSGALTNQATGGFLAGARVVLCQLTSEKVCIVRSDLTAVTNDKGVFLISGAQPGKYVVLYNGSGQKRAEWDGLKIDFTPVQVTGAGSSVMRAFAQSLGVKTLSGCAFSIVIKGINKIGESGYVYSEDIDLAVILIESEPVMVNVDGGKKPVTLSVWNTRKSECDNKKFAPVP